jgi:mRNA interferase MazF
LALEEYLKRRRDTQIKLRLAHNLASADVEWEEMRRGEIWWTSTGEPSGSAPGFRRPAVIISANSFNVTPLRTVIVAFLTTSSKRALDPGNVRVPAGSTGLARDSVLNVTQLATLDRRTLTEHIGRVPDRLMRGVDAGLRLVLAL